MNLNSGFVALLANMAVFCAVSMRVVPRRSESVYLAAHPVDATN